MHIYLLAFISKEKKLARTSAKNETKGDKMLELLPAFARPICTTALIN